MMIQERISGQDEGSGALSSKNPEPRLELQNHCIGKIIGLLCQIGGWFVPMYGARKLESQNTGEYEDAAKYAMQSGHIEMLDDLLTMAEVEWDHEKYLRDKCRSHFLYKWFPKWKTSPARESIRQAFAHLRYPKGKLPNEHVPTVLPLGESRPFLQLLRWERVLP